MTYYPAFAQLLNQYLQAQDRTPTWLAKRLGINPGTVNRWLNLDMRPGSPDMVARVADILGVHSSPERHKLLVAAGYGYQELPHSSRAEATSSDERIRSTDTVRQHNLPPQLTPFVGRQQELTDISSMLAQSDCRLITVLGIGGVGKTRFALKVAEHRGDTFSDGVCFVPLAGLESAASLITTLADALGFSFYDARDLQVQLLRYLRHKEMLLVLDNFEHLLEGTSLVTEILKHAPGVKLLVTSRTRLNLPWEWVFALEGLAVPVMEEQEDKESFSAVQLFLYHARRVSRGFSPTSSNTADIVRVCQVVEGMPLALELIASWVRVLSCHEILVRLQQGLDLLATTSQEALERHRSMRAVFEHSWRLLSTEEQEVFRHLCIFHGGFDRNAAEQVAGASLSTLTALVDKCLVHTQTPERYKVHELLRQYAQEKQDETPRESAEALNARHAHYYAQFLQELMAPLSGGNQMEALQRIEHELENVRAAWGWAVDHNDLGTIERSTDSLARFFSLRSLSQEGNTAFALAIEKVRMFTEALEGSERDEQQLIGKLLLARAKFLVETGMYEQASLLAQHAVELGASIQQVSIEAEGFLQWGRSLWILGKYESAHPKLERALILARSAQLRHVEADSLRYLGNIASDTGDFPRDRAYYEQALYLYREMGDGYGECLILGCLGIFFYQHGDYIRGKEFYEQELHMSRKIGNRAQECHALNGLGDIYIECGNYSKAKEYNEQALHISRESNNLRYEGVILGALARIYYCLGDNVIACQYCQQALVNARQIGTDRTQGITLTIWGHALVGQKRLPEAVDAYQRASAVRRKLGEHHLLMEPLAGLADISLIQGAVSQAQTQVEEILEFLKTNTLTGTDDLRIFLTCYRVLEANEDLRAGEILNTAYRVLQERADKVSDAPLRRSLLENVAIHREIVEAYNLNRGAHQA